MLCISYYNTYTMLEKKQLITPEPFRF